MPPTQGGRKVRARQQACRWIMGIKLPLGILALSGEHNGGVRGGAWEAGVPKTAGKEDGTATF